MIKIQNINIRIFVSHYTKCKIYSGPFLVMTHRYESREKSHVINEVQVCRKVCLLTCHNCQVLYLVGPISRSSLSKQKTCRQ